MTEEEKKIIEDKIVKAVRVRNTEDSYNKEVDLKYCVGYNPNAPAGHEADNVRYDQYGKPIIDWEKYAPNNGAKEGTRRVLSGIPKGCKFDRFGGESTGFYVGYKRKGKPDSFEKRSLPAKEGTTGHPQNYEASELITTEKLNAWFNGLSPQKKAEELEDFRRKADTRASDYIDMDIEAARKMISILEGEDTIDLRIADKINEFKSKTDGSITEEKLEEIKRKAIIDMALDAVYQRNDKGDYTYTSEEIWEMLSRIGIKVDFKIYISEIAPAFGKEGGGIQIELPLSVEKLKSIGMVRDDEVISQDIYEDICEKYENFKQLNPDKSLEEFLEETSMEPYVDRVLEDYDMAVEEQKKAENEVKVHESTENVRRSPEEIYEAAIDDVEYNKSNIDQVCDEIRKDVERQQAMEKQIDNEYSLGK